MHGCSPEACELFGWGVRQVLDVSGKVATDPVHLASACGHMGWQLAALGVGARTLMEELRPQGEVHVETVL